jgi:hypothetical protein
MNFWPIKRCWLFLVALLPYTLIAEPPKFESYRVLLHQIKTFAQTQIPKSGIDWKMEEYLHYSDEEPLNFADRYTLEEIGCRTGCVDYCLIDRITGVVYPGTDFNQDFPNEYRGPSGFQYRRDSRLVVIYSATNFEYPVHVSYYVWEDLKLKFLEADEIQSSK